jgi:integrase
LCNGILALPQDASYILIERANIMLVSSFYRSYYEPLLLLEANPNTPRQYLANIKRLDDALKRPSVLDDLTRDNITLVAQKIIRDGRSPSTANKTISQLRALLNEAVRRGLAKHDRLPRLKEYQRTPTAWTAEQIDRLYSVCWSQQGMIGKVPARLWWVALHDLLMDTGIRAGALLELQWAHIDWDRGILLVPAEIQKDDSDQSFRLHHETLLHLRQIEAPARKLILPWDRCYSVIWYRYGKILKEAGLPATRRDKFHRMRRTTATHFEAAGGDATELLGHSSRDTTRRYLDEQIINRVHPCDVIRRPQPKRA